MRKLFGSSRREVFDRLAERSGSRQSVALSSPAHGIVHDDPVRVLRALESDGICVLESTLPEPLCVVLEELAGKASCTLVGGVADAPPTAVFDPGAPLAVRYDVPEQQLVNDRSVQSLLSDRSLISLAQQYLGTTPVQDLVTMWWTSASSEGSSAAAQHFHFDLDRLRFLKFFVYLSDVDTRTGPHQFVRGSHRQLPDELRQDRRYDDAEVLAHFALDDVLTIEGGRGTMFVADTRGLHKGLPVERGWRLVFQMEFSTCLFGAPVERPTVHEPSEEFRRAVEELPETFRRFSLNGS